MTRNGDRQVWSRFRDCNEIVPAVLKKSCQNHRAKFTSRFMSEVAIEFNPEEHRAKWLKRLVDELDKIEAVMVFKILPDGIEYPSWVLKVEREFCLVMLPAAKLKEPDFKITPKRMGAVLGHMCEMAVWMMEWFNNLSESKDDQEKNPLTEKPLTEEEWKKGQELLFSLDVWYCAMLRLAKRALCSCVDQPYEDMTDFLLG